jgi:hypothetical protein
MLKRLQVRERRHPPCPLPNNPFPTTPSQKPLPNKSLRNNPLPTHSFPTTPSTHTLTAAAAPQAKPEPHIMRLLDKQV